MQSIAPVPDEPSWKTWWKKPGFYLWMLAICGMIYNSMVYKDLQMNNTVWLFFLFLGYYMFVKLWYSISVESVSLPDPLPPTNANMKTALSVFNAMLTIMVFVLLCVFFRDMWYGIVIYVLMIVYYVYKNNQSGIVNKFTQGGSLNANYFAFSILFPIQIIIAIINHAAAVYAEAKKDAITKKDKESVPSPLGYEIVIGSAMAICVVALIMFRYNYADLMQKSTEIATSSLINFVTTFPLIQYFKYVANNDYLDVAKRVIVVALSAYVAYLMYGVYIKKNSLSMCPDSPSPTPTSTSTPTGTPAPTPTPTPTGTPAPVSFSSLVESFFESFSSLFDHPEVLSTCFDHPEFFGTSDIPCVNTLVWVLIYCSIINVVNWITKTFGTSVIGTSSTKGAIERMWEEKMKGTNGTPPNAGKPSENPPTDIGTLVRLLVFPVYWIFALFAQHPVAAIVGMIAFAVLGLLLYRSSFDLTTFMEGQRGTVITLFALFIVSLIVFGVYAMNSSTTGMVEGAMSYGQFIAKTGLIIAVAVCAVSLLMYCLSSHSKLARVASIAQYGITALICIAGIAIVIGLARTVFSTSRKMGGSMFQVSPDSNWVMNLLKLIANLLFYLPCLMLDAVDMLKEQYRLTTPTFLIILAMEAAFILAGHLLPSAVVKALNHTGVHVLSAPISMTKLTPMTAHEIQFVDVDSIANNTKKSHPDSVLLHNYNYGLSAWFYIHPQPPNTNSNYDASSYMNILTMGDSFGPVIKYNPKLNAMQFSIYGKPIAASPNGPPFTLTDIPLQTWNNVVINSDKGMVDIFINNSLIYTGTHLPDKKSQEWFTISTGQADGIHGEICNIMLNTTPFTKTEIAWLYNTNKALNPPIVGADQTASDDTTTTNSDSDSDSGNSGMKPFSIVGAVLGALFGWLFNDEADALKGLVMGAITFGLIGALLGNLFSTDGTIAYVLKTGANVFVDTF